MGRKTRGRVRKTDPVLPAVDKVELSNEHLKLRIAAAVLFLVIGATALAYGFSNFTSVSGGWQEIKADSFYESCAGDFLLYYNLGASGMSARTENRGLVRVYTSAAESAYKIFNATEVFSGVGNLAVLNLHPNETVELDPALYEALELIKKYGVRDIYLGPVYQIYDGIFTCSEDWQTVDFDPEQNEYLRGIFERVAGYALDPQSVDIQLLGGDMARLNVSKEYLAYAESEELGSFVDLYWMKNAFIADYLADALAGAGYTSGTVSSYDGFERNLDGVSNTVYGLNILDCPSGQALIAASMNYSGTMSLVSLRNFPAGEHDGWYYYVTDTGEVKHRFLSLEDGLMADTLQSMTAYANNLGCAEILVLARDAFFQKELDEQSLLTLRNFDIEAVALEDRILYCTDHDTMLTGLYESAALSYDIDYIE